MCFVVLFEGGAALTLTSFASLLNNKKVYLDKVFRSNEKEKKRSYGRRIVEVEHGSFTPLVLIPMTGIE